METASSMGFFLSMLGTVVVWLFSESSSLLPLAVMPKISLSRRSLGSCDSYWGVISFCISHPVTPQTLCTTVIIFFYYKVFLKISGHPSFFITMSNEISPYRCVLSTVSAHSCTPYTINPHTAIKFRHLVENGQFVLLLLVLRKRLPPPSSE